MNIGIPQIIVIALYSCNLLLAANRHGKVGVSKTNFWVTLGGTAAMLALLAWGGFFG